MQQIASRNKDVGLLVAYLLVTSLIPSKIDNVSCFFALLRVLCFVLL
jgi:hypothetical protein